jgi:hypothetical protein
MGVEICDIGRYTEPGKRSNNQQWTGAFLGEVERAIKAIRAIRIIGTSSGRIQV